MTGNWQLSSNSVEVAPFISKTERANSITDVCMPKQMPRNGTLCSRAYWMVEILPSTPRQPKPPGTKIPSTSLYTSAKSVPSASTASESTHLMFTFVSSTIPA